MLHFFFQAEDGIRDADVTGVQTCALPILDFTLFLFNAFSVVAIFNIIEPFLPKNSATLSINSEKIYINIGWLWIFVCTLALVRSEERRVGKVCRCGWVWEHLVSSALGDMR